MFGLEEFRDALAEDLEPVLGRLRAQWAADIARKRLFSMDDPGCFSARDRRNTMIRLGFDLGRPVERIAAEFHLSTIDVWRILADDRGRR